MNTYKSLQLQQGRSVRAALLTLSQKETLIIYLLQDTTTAKDAVLKISK